METLENHNCFFLKILEIWILFCKKTVTEMQTLVRRCHTKSGQGAKVGRLPPSQLFNTAALLWPSDSAPLPYQTPDAF